MQSRVLAMAIAIGLGATSFSALAAPHKAHRRQATVTDQTMNAASMQSNDVATSRQEIAELKNQLAAMQAQIVALEERTDAQSDVNEGMAKNVETLQTSTTKVDKLEKLVNDTGVSGKAYIDVSTLSQKNHGIKTNASGTGIDVKRFYLTVNHTFNDIWSANLTTDFNYVANDGETNLFVKKAYLQGKFSDAAVFRVGSADMPWIPYVENFYGFRYVENTLIDKLKFGNSADWGLNLAGKVGGGFDYSVSAVNGGGYKNPTRSKRVDFEGRVGFAPFEHAVVAVGAYSGTLGKETQTVNSQHTANRVDALAAYANGNTRFGVEYFQANNWNNVLTIARDKADGYSIWGSYGVSEAATLFARYDHSRTSRDLNPDLKDTYFNAGVEFLLRKGLKVSAVYKNDHLQDAAATDLKTQEVGVWGELAF